MIVSSLLTMHLLVLSGAIDSASVHPLRLVTNVEAFRLGSAVRAGSLGVPALRYLALGQVDLEPAPPLPLTNPPGAATDSVEPPVEDRRFNVMATEVMLGAGILLVHDGFVFGVGLGLFLLGNSGALGGSPTSFSVGALAGLVGLAVIDLVVAPFLVAAIAYATSRAFGDQGGSFWRAVKGAFVGEGATLVAATLLIALGVTIDSYNRSVNPNSGLTFTLIALLLSEAIRVIGMPLAASNGLHWGQAVLAPPSTPVSLPSDTAETTAGRPSFAFNVLSVHFG